MANKVISLLEFVLLFLALPVIFYFDLLPVPKVAALLVITLLCVLVLWQDASYDLNQLFYRPERPDFLKRLIWQSGLAALVIIILVLVIQPDKLLAFPKERPIIWGIVMVLYPVLSALPQELLYREYFFTRYDKLFETEWMLVLMSAASFSFLHIIYDNEWALVLSLAGGFVFARTYRQTRSLYWVSLEHAIYGCLVFTIGMGNYFYEGF